MNYQIVGADGKIYGPIPLKQIQQWLTEGRADQRTPVYVEGASNWTYLGLLPELRAEFAAPPPASTPTAGTGTAGLGPPRRANGFATAGLIFALLSWACCCCLPFNLLGLCFSIIALVQMQSQPQPQEGRLFAITGLVLSAANLLFSLAAVALQLVLNPGVIHWQTGPF